MNYDKTYFIAKFTAIPDALWCTGDYILPNGRHCARGFCGHRNHKPTKEGDALDDLIRQLGYTASNINDGNHPSYQQRTPKARILAALNDLP